MQSKTFRLLIWVFLLVAVLTFSMAAKAVGETKTFDDLLTISPSSCQYIEDKDILWVVPPSEGVLAIEYFRVDTSGYPYTLENATTIFLACVEEMKSNYLFCDVSLQDIFKIGSYYALHTHDISIDVGYYACSDGYLIWTAKGVIALWFVSDSTVGRIPVDFVHQTLLTVALPLDPSDALSPPTHIFNTDQVSKLLATGPSHLFFWECETPVYKKVARNPSNYLDTKATYSGTVLQTIENALECDFRLQLDNSDDVIYVSYNRSSEREARILEGDHLQVWGTLSGLKTYTSTFGEQISIPSLAAKYVMLIEE